MGCMKNWTPGEPCSCGGCMWLHKDWGEGAFPPEFMVDGQYKSYEKMLFAINFPSSYTVWTPNYNGSLINYWRKTVLSGMEQVNGSYEVIRDPVTYEWTPAYPSTPTPVSYVESQYWVMDNTDCPVLSEQFPPLEGEWTMGVNAGAGDPTLPMRIVRVVFTDGANATRLLVNLDGENDAVSGGYYTVQKLVHRFQVPKDSATNICSVVGTDTGVNECGTLTNVEPTVPAEIDTTSAQDDRFVLSGGAYYDYNRAKIMLPGGGKIRSVEGLGKVSLGAVVARVNAPHLDVAIADHEAWNGSGGPYAYGYGYGTADGTPGVRLRLFFESDDLEQTYKYVDIVQLVYDGVIKWRTELGYRVAGADTVFHYDYGINLNENSNTNILQRGYTTWLHLTRLQPYLTDPDYRETEIDGYAGHTAESTQNAPDTPAGEYARLPSYGQMIDDVGTSIETGLFSPPGTHFGIVRMDSYQYPTELSAVAAGKTSVYPCLRRFIATHAPCLEIEPMTFRAVVNNSFAGTVWTMYGTRDALNPFLASTANDGAGTYWTVVALFKLLAPVDNPQTIPRETSWGHQDAIVRIEIEVTEEQNRSDPETASTGTFTRIHDIQLDSHALACDGFHLIVAIEDMDVVTEGAQNPPVLSQLELIGSL